MEKILVGNMVMAGEGQDIAQLAHDGFESVALNFRSNDALEKFIGEASRFREQLGVLGIRLSCVSTYGNPLTNQDDAYRWRALPKAAQALGCDCITGFTGALTGQPMMDSLKPFGEFFTPLAKEARDMGMKIGFENCPMGGTWRSAACNIAVNPDAWERMFNEVNEDNIGLEWEPAHQLEQLIDPISQLRKWVQKVVHVHGKDANLDRDVITRHGVMGAEHYCMHRFPGYGDTNWASIFSILSRAGYGGYVDIEGWHDPIYRDELEYEGQRYALNYLKECRDKGAIYKEVK